MKEANRPKQRCYLYMWVLFTMDPNSESPFCQHASSTDVQTYLNIKQPPHPPQKISVSFSCSMLFQKILGMLSHTEDDIRKSFLNCLRYFWLRTQ